MTTKLITGYVNSVDLTAPYGALSISSTGTVGSYGVTTGTVSSYAIVNDGTIRAAVSDVGGVKHGKVGITLNDGGHVVNGGTADTGALVYGLTGIEVLRHAGTVVNFATIRAGGEFGIVLGAGGTITNGSARDTHALIVGEIEVAGTGASSVTNFGTIEAAAGSDALAISGGRALVIAEPGAVFDGVVNGGTGGSTFELAAGIGSFANLAEITSFAEIEVAAQGTWQLTGSEAVGAGTTLAVLGRLDSAAVLSVAGTVDNTGFVALGGGLTLGGNSTGRFDNQSGGTLDLTASERLATVGGAGSGIGNQGLVEMTGSGTATLAAAIANGGTIAAAAGTLTLAGAVTGTGLIEIDGGAVLQARGAVAATQLVLFAGSGAELALLAPAAFKAQLAGFGRTDRLDFRTILEGSKTKVHYAKGTLSVTDGTHTASVTLLGQFAAAGFATASDGNGGTLVTYTPPPSVRPGSLAPPAG